MRKPDMYAESPSRSDAGMLSTPHGNSCLRQACAVYADAIADAVSAAVSAGGGGDACRGAGIGSTFGHVFLMASCSLTVHPFGPETAPTPKSVLSVTPRT